LCRDSICEIVEVIGVRMTRSIEHLHRLQQAKTALSQALPTGRTRVPGKVVEENML